MRGTGPDLAAVDALLCACVSGRPAPWPAQPPADLADALVDRARFHRLPALLVGVLRRPQSTTDAWPPAVVGWLADLARRQAALEMLQGREIRRVLSALLDAEVRGVLMKGTALAYTRYAAPHLRPRADTDLLGSVRARERAETVLLSLGYVRAPRIAGSLVEYQVPYFRDTRSGLRHVFDLHWRVFNRQVLAERFPFGELAAYAVPAPRLGEGARALDPVDAILVACLHGPAHHRLEVRPLVEFHDIHLLANGFDSADWAELRQRATRRGVRRLCLHGLRATERRFGTAIPVEVADALDSTDARAEPSARLLITARDPFFEDLRALGSWSRRLRFLREAAFPSADYIRDHYGVRARSLLPLLYLHRGVSGLWRRGIAR